VIIESFRRAAGEKRGKKNTLAVTMNHAYDDDDDAHGQYTTSYNIDEKDVMGRRDR